MIQLRNGFKPCYYVTEQGRIFNKDTNSYLIPLNNCLKLATLNGDSKNISIKEAYRLAYNKEFCQDSITNLQDEEWKAIEGTNDRYYISNKGRVKSLCGYKSKLLKPAIIQNGYCRVSIKVDDRYQNYLIHKLVAAAFLEPRGKGRYQIHHIDFNKLNNSADNLEYLTPKEHSQKHKERLDNECTKSKNCDNK